MFKEQGLPAAEQGFRERRSLPRRWQRPHPTLRSCPGRRSRRGERSGPSGAQPATRRYRKQAIDSSSPGRSRPNIARRPLIRTPLVLPRSRTEHGAAVDLDQAAVDPETRIEMSRASHPGLAAHHDQILIHDDVGLLRGLADESTWERLLIQYVR